MAPVWIEAGFVAMIVPLYLIVIAEFGAKLVPFTITVLPGDPEVGVKLMEETAVTSKEAVAERGVPLTVVDALTVCMVTVDWGTANVAVKVPVTEAVIAAGFVVTGLPSKVIVTLEPAGKFEPETLTEEATAPEVGLNEMDGTITVNPAVVEVVPLVALTRPCPAAADAGTENVALKLPSVLLVTVGGAVDTAVPLKVIVTGALAG